jgi:hypothetical protein
MTTKMMTPMLTIKTKTKRNKKRANDALVLRASERASKLHKSKQFKIYQTKSSRTGTMIAAAKPVE